MTVGDYKEPYEDALRDGLSEEDALKKAVDSNGGAPPEESGFCGSDLDWLYDKLNESFSRRTTLEELKKQKFSYEDVPQRKEVPLIISEPFLDLIFQKEKGCLDYDLISRLYKARMGVGRQPFFILVPSSVNLSMGETQICLRRLSAIEAKKKLIGGLDDYELELLVQDIRENKRYKIIKKQLRGAESYIWFKSGKLDQFREIEEQCEELEEILDGFIFEPMDTVHTDFVRLAVSKFGFEKILSDFLDENYTHDPDFMYLARAGLVNFGNKTCPKLMRYQPHMLMQTNTKIGKSHIFEKICGELKFDRASAANLLGFSGGKKSEVKEGTLNNHHKSSCWDDLEKNFGEGLVDDLPTLLEQGEAKIRKGIQNITTR